MLVSDVPMLTQLQWGLPQNLRVPAATLIYDTFRRKFKYSLGPRQKGIRFIAHSLRDKYALVALQGGKLVGLAGVKNSHGELIEIQFGLWLRTYHVHAFRSFLVGFPFWYERLTPGVLKLTNLCVNESVREQGLGTSMIQEFIRYGKDKGFQVLKLEVINSNIRAKALYERLGFEITRYTKIPFPWSHLYGFTGIYEMSYPLV